MSSTYSCLFSSVTGMSSPPGLSPMVRRSPKKSISTENVRQKVSCRRTKTQRGYTQKYVCVCLGC